MHIINVMPGCLQGLFRAISTNYVRVFPIVIVTGCSIDLGLGRAFTVPIKSYTFEAVTLWYRAKRYSMALDIWFLGCIFAELQTLFLGDSQIQELISIFRLLETHKSLSS